MAIQMDNTSARLLASLVAGDAVEYRKQHNAEFALWLAAQKAQQLAPIKRKRRNSCKSTV